jgi:hypothetical protein
MPLPEGLQGEKRVMMKRLSKSSRLRALRRLLDYAIAEGEELGLADMDKLLGAAAQAISDELDNLSVLVPKPADRISQKRN